MLALPKFARLNRPSEFANSHHNTSEFTASDGHAVDAFQHKFTINEENIYIIYMRITVTQVTAEDEL